MALLRSLSFLALCLGTLLLARVAYSHEEPQLSDKSTYSSQAEFSEVTAQASAFINLSEGGVQLPVSLISVRDSQRISQLNLRVACAAVFFRHRLIQQFSSFLDSQVLALKQALLFPFHAFD
jgi:hypothetical protein